MVMRFDPKLVALVAALALAVPASALAQTDTGEPIAPGADDANATTRDTAAIESNTTLTDTIDEFELYQDAEGNRYVRVDENNWPMGMAEQDMETAGIVWPDWLTDGGDDGVFQDEAGNRYVQLDDNDQVIGPNAEDANATTRDFSAIESNTTVGPSDRQ